MGYDTWSKASSGRRVTDINQCHDAIGDPKLALALRVSKRFRPGASRAGL